MEINTTEKEKQLQHCIKRVKQMNDEIEYLRKNRDNLIEFTLQACKMTHKEFKEIYPY
jgi:hypothetical protein